PNVHFTTDDFLNHPDCPPATRKLPAPHNVPTSFKHHGQLVEMHKEHDWPPFGIAFKGSRALFPGFEFDTGKEPMGRKKHLQESSLERHLLSTLALLNGDYSKHYGIPKHVPVRVPFYCLGKTRTRKAMEKLRDLTKGDGHPDILFMSLPNFTKLDVFPP